ncbi:MAG: glycosyltransferase [Bacteroidales bacterium]|nr:glycosyltransferase [Candidatus Colicola caccequi]
MISVCIATYNGEKYIREQLMSILPQLSAEDEVIISDDASTDNTLQVISDLHDSRIQIYHHTSYEPCYFPLDKSTHNFENALIHAKGEYIFLSDQDDIWLSDKVTTMLQELAVYDLVVHNCQVVDAQLNTICPSYFDLVHIHKGIWANIYKNSCLGCCIAFRRHLLDTALPFPSHYVAHDQWLVICASLKGTMSLVHQPFLLYRKHNTSQTPSGEKSAHSWSFKIKYRLVVVYYTLLKILHIN